MDNINDLIRMLEDANKAKQLLEKVWCEIGPYNGTLSDETRRELEEYFDFDDSE